jgi:hypothetical protein
MNPSIVIDDFEFTLIRYEPNAVYGRGLLEVKSVNKTSEEETIFFCYKSISESGIWRALNTSNTSVTSGIGDIYKGIDYMSSSTIDFKLQKFIYEKIKKGEILIDKIVITPETAERMNNLDLQEILSTRSRTNQMGRRSDIFRGKYYDSHCGYMTGNIREELNEISTIMEKNYEFNSEPKFLFNYTDKILYGSMSGLDRYLYITANVYSIALKKNSEDSSIFSNLDFYYINYSLLSEEKYVLESGESEDFNKLDFFAPLTITPSNTTINKYGLFGQVISLHSYVCKIIEYNGQIPPGVFFKISDIYSFIGELYNDLFPYNKIKEKEKYPLIDLHELRDSIKSEKRKDIEHEGGSYKLKKYIDKITKTNNLNKIGLYVNKIKKYK